MACHPLSEWQAVTISLSMSSSFVLSLYLVPARWRRLHRDEPASIRARFIAVSAATAFSISIFFIVTHGGECFGGVAKSLGVRHRNSHLNMYSLRSCADCRRTPRSRQRSARRHGLNSVCLRASRIERSALLSSRSQRLVFGSTHGICHDDIKRSLGMAPIRWESVRMECKQASWLVAHHVDTSIDADHAQPSCWTYY